MLPPDFNKAINEFFKATQLPRIEYIVSLLIIIFLTSFRIIIGQTFIEAEAFIAGLLIFFFVWVTLKRIYDIGISSWFILLLFVPFINALFILFLVYQKGHSEGDYRFSR